MTRARGTRHGRHPVQAVAKVLDHPLAELLVAGVARRSDGVVQDRVDFCLQELLLALRTTGASQPAEQRADAGPSHQRGGGRAPVVHPGVGPLLEEFVVPGADHEQVGLVAGQFLHQQALAVTGVRDPAAVDDLPRAVRLGVLQAGLEPAAERSAVVIRVPEGRRASEAENPVGARPLLCRKALRIEVAELYGIGPHRVSVAHEQRRARLEADVGILGQVEGLDPQNREGSLQEKEERRHGTRAEDELLAPGKLRLRPRHAFELSSFLSAFRMAAFAPSPAMRTAQEHNDVRKGK